MPSRTPPVAPADPPSDCELAVVGPLSREEIDAWVRQTAASMLGVPVRTIVFRSGRIDSV